MNFNKLKTKENFVTALTLVFILILLVIPNKFDNGMYANSIKVKAKVIEVNNDQVKHSGLISYGEQICTIQISKGKFKGQVCTGANLMSGQIEADKIFSVGDNAFVILDYENDEITHATMIDHYRLDLELFLALGFIFILLIFAKGIGFRSILSFIFTVLMVWKVLIPSFLLGHNPILVSIAVVFVLTIIIIGLVYGFDRRGISAISGALAGTLVTGLMASIFVSAFKIHGAVMAFSESLLYSGYQNINLTSIFTASIFIAASGAMMDVAVDISSAMSEIKSKNPDISRKELIKSGFSVGRAVMGTMTTTLLLAYSGGYIGLIMVFMAQGTPIDNILNLKYVSSEILHTIVGSFGLVTVAPLTAIACGFLSSQKHKDDGESQTTT